MSGTPSFERFDYVLRTNKHIERKLVFDVLQSADRIINLHNHWYLGFGSMWFSDFRLAHRLLGMRSMLSLEHAEHAERAEFNRPFSSVTVSGGDSTVILEKLEAEKWEKPLIAWLDYDGEVNNGVVDDLALIIDRAAQNSVVILTVNAARGTYRVRKPGGQLNRSETSVGVVESFLGAHCTPPRFVPALNNAGFSQDVRESDFPGFLAEALLTFLQHRIINGAREHNGERIRFVPLYNLCHKDGADMVTVGGAICTESDAAKWRECIARNPALANQDGETTHCRLDLIPVTLKEKITLDACLPIPDDDQIFIAKAKALGLALKDDELRKYRQLHRHFPVFAETSF